jgi:hypothetical protein
MKYASSGWAGHDAVHNLVDRADRSRITGDVKRDGVCVARGMIEGTNDRLNGTVD